MNPLQEPLEAASDDAVLAIDVGGSTIHTAVLGPKVSIVETLPTTVGTEPFNVERLCRIATELNETAVSAGVKPSSLTVVVPGQVDEFHGAVQYSANLPWHDVAVGTLVGGAVPCEVIVRHSVRAAALAESNVGAARGDGTMLFVSLGTGIAAAGASSGVVVADHVGAGDIGTMRIRSGPGAGQILEDLASAPAIARRYAERRGIDPANVSAADVHAVIGSDPDARHVWNEAVGALADGLEWATILFGPEVLVLGGGLVNAGSDLIDPLIADLDRRFASRPAPSVRAAAFGEYAGLVGGAFTGWKKARWGIDQFEAVAAGLGAGKSDGVASPS